MQFELTGKRSYAIIAVASIIIFILGAYLPQLTNDIVPNSSGFSLFSGLSLGLIAATFLLFINSQIKVKINNKFLEVVFYLAIIVSLLLYPPIISFLTPHISNFLGMQITWEVLLTENPYTLIVFAGFNAIANLLTYQFGFNTRRIYDDEKKKEVIKFLLSVVTLVSLLSIAISFVLTISNSAQKVSEFLSSSFNRAIIASAYCIVPIATFSLGYVSKLIENQIVKNITIFLALIFGFFIGTTVLLMLGPNRYFFSASIPMSLTIGLLITEFSKSDMS